MVETDKSQMAIEKRRMRFLCWINKTTKTRSEYVMIIAITRQQLLHQRVRVLGYSYIACLVKYFLRYFYTRLT